MVGVVVLLGATGLGVNPVLIAQTLRHSGHGSTLASSLATSAFNLGTAVGTAVAGATLSSSWGLVGPAALGAVLTGSALLPVAWIALHATRGLRTDHDTTTSTEPALLTR